MAYQIKNKFEPADFSIEELTFIKEHLRETPTVALHGDSLPKGVNPIAIQVALGKFSELDALSKLKPDGRRKPQPWCGYEAIEESIDRFIAWQELSLKIQKQGGPRHPSQHSWDSMGTMTTGGIGTDSVEKVRNEIVVDEATGRVSRRPFAVELLKVNGKSLDMPWVPKPGGRVIEVDRVEHNQEDGTYKCTICNKVVASYDTDGGRKAKNSARALAVKHLKTSRKEHARHRAICNVPFD